VQIFLVLLLAQLLVVAVLPHLAPMRLKRLVLTLAVRRLRQRLRQETLGQFKRQIWRKIR
tara:strand:+ start:96 stop:275 length:180 start_codon:yes stop_codon:yes gene_type:complete